jgi:DtxR family Mn-dependent transcriptional regulator
MANPFLALTVAGLLVALAVLVFWPGSGLYFRWRRARRVTERVLIEDALKHINKCEVAGRLPTVESVAGALQVSTNATVGLLDRMQALGLLTVQNGDFHLTAEGRSAALHIIRAHRLWERYLADRTGYEESEWHERAERYEHMLQPADADLLAAQLGNPIHDPHGDPIPDAGGEYVAHGGSPLTALPVGQLARVVHMEDEPEAVYAQLVAEGMYPGMMVRLMSMSRERVRFWADGDEHVLAPVLAANISVVPVQEEAWVETDLRAFPDVSEETLASLDLGQQGRVVALSPRLRGEDRRRMMDLGILPGTMVHAELQSPSGDPVAYRIRDALIALREEQAQLIHIMRQKESA